MSDETKAVVTVCQMARMVGLSRARFYQLQKAGVFPPPMRDAESGRPFYTEEIQKVCLEVRHRNCGINGKPVLFYSRRLPITTSPARPRNVTAKPPKNEHVDLLDSLQALGLASVTAAQVGQAVKEIFPQGTAGVDQAEVVRAVFLHLRRKDSGGNVGK
jgi:predicted DNA-binding transcriptional regulator AlpA